MSNWVVDLTIETYIQMELNENIPFSSIQTMVRTGDFKGYDHQKILKALRNSVKDIREGIIDGSALGEKAEDEYGDAVSDVQELINIIKCSNV